MDSTIYCYNIASYSRKPLQRYEGFKNGSYYIRACLSPDGQYLISGSSDEKAYIWNVDNPNPVAVLCGGDNINGRNFTCDAVEMSCVAWSQSRDLRIVTCTDDGRHKIWRIGASDPDAPTRKSYRQWAYIHPQYGRKIRASKVQKTWWSNGGCTPSSSGRVAQKRTFAELDDDVGEMEFSDAKRSVEPRGRRLFTTSLATNPPADEKSPIKSPTKSSPLSERINGSFDTPSTSHVSVSLFSPTSNLPNYVVDGQAPHLRAISPKKKWKENVDWLTKIRKQKLQQASMQVVCETGDSTSRPSSPRIQSLREATSSPCSATPRRRTSRSCSTSERPRTPNRHETILKFLTPTSSASPGRK